MKERSWRGKMGMWNGFDLKMLTHCLLSWGRGCLLTWQKGAQKGRGVRSCLLTVYLLSILKETGLLSSR